MKVVYNWLKDFVDVTAPPQELATRAATAENASRDTRSARGAII